MSIPPKSAIIGGGGTGPVPEGADPPTRTAVATRCEAFDHTNPAAQ